MLGKFNGINTCRIFVLFWCISLCAWLGFIPQTVVDAANVQSSPNAVDASDKLIRAGYQVYLVGGSVRDLVLGEAPNDFDLTTNASFDEQATVFKEQMSSHGHPNGITYGKVIYKEGNKEEDIENILAKQAQAAPLRSKEMAAARAELHYLRELQP